MTIIVRLISRRLPAVSGVIVISAIVARVACVAPVHAWPEPTGDIYGSVSDGRTCAPIQYAHVTVAGTMVGEMLDRDGKYRLRDVPVGKQTVRVLMLGYGPANVTVDVVAGESVRADVTLHEEWFDGVPPKPARTPDKCSEHSKRMQWVLVPTEAAVHLVLPQGVDKPEYPNDWPKVHGSVDAKPLKAGWGQSCQACVDGWNSMSSRDNWRGLVDDYPSSWKLYAIPNTVDFFAPAGLVDSVAVDSCTIRGVWKRKDLRIDIMRVPATRDVFFIGAPMPSRGAYAVFESVGHCKASIWVTERNDSARLLASVASTTVSIDNLDISIVATGKNASKIARTVLGTLLFPATD